MYIQHVRTVVITKITICFNDGFFIIAHFSMDINTDKTVIQGFVQPSYTFMENQGLGVIEIDGPSGLTGFNISGGTY